ncbi:oxidoreductase [Candidatus Dependentiae bacterium Noda2021]|nr:oxidoreductase [Candidatus Dependentiae bacterium Noda2021]
MKINIIILHIALLVPSCISTKEQKKLRWGILSTAVFSEDIVKTIRQSDRSEVAAVASRSLQKAQDYANKHQIPIAYASYEELIDDPSIDVIFNPLPNSMHGTWTVKAAQSGKHVLCEKPLVTTLEELDAIEKAAQDHNVTIFEAFAYLHHPQTTKLKELMAAKRIGDIRSINCWLSINLPQRFAMNEQDPNHIRLRPELCGGSLWDLGSYCTSIILTLQPEAHVENILAFTRTGKTSVDVQSTVTLKLSNGVIAQFSTDFYAPYRAGLHIVGTHGSIEVDAPWHPFFFDNKDSHITVTDNDSNKEVYPFNGNLYLYEIQAMEACILDNAKPVVSLAESRAFLQTMLKIKKHAIVC